jgi:hypothetical protein
MASSGANFDQKEISVFAIEQRSPNEIAARGERQPSNSNECIESPTGSARTKRHC